MESELYLKLKELYSAEDLKNPEKLAKFIVAVLDSRKAHDIKLLYVEKQTVLADYFVICTGNSRTQIRSLADDVEYYLSLFGVSPAHIEGEESGVWILEDFFSVIVHIFNEEARGFYKLEKLYQETSEQDISDIITED